MTVRLPKELIGAIELLANKSGMSRADVIRNLIEQSLDALAGAKKAHRTRE